MHYAADTHSVAQVKAEEDGELEGLLDLVLGHPALPGYKFIVEMGTFEIRPMQLFLKFVVSEASHQDAGPTGSIIMACRHFVEACLGRRTVNFERLSLAVSLLCQANQHLGALPTAERGQRRADNKTFDFVRNTCLSETEEAACDSHSDFASC